MKRISVDKNTIVESRLYKAGGYMEGDMPVQDFDALLSGGHARIIGDAPSGAPVTLPFMPETTPDNETQSSSGAPEPSDEEPPVPPASEPSGDSTPRKSKWRR